MHLWSLSVVHSHMQSLRKQITASSVPHLRGCSGLTELQGLSKLSLYSSSSNLFWLIWKHMWYLQAEVQAVSPKAIVLSGGPNSVHLEDSPQLPKGLLDWCQQEGIPVLGICYGLQLMVHVSVSAALKY